MLTNDRTAYRRAFCDVWRKHRQALPLTPLECQIRDVILAHPEYQGLVEQTETVLAREFHAEDGEENPFLHMGLHLAILDQVSMDRPPGIRSIYKELLNHYPDSHQAEHAMMGCLQRMILGMQAGAVAVEGEYLNCLRRLLS